MLSNQELLEKFDELMSHLNSEDNSMAEEFRINLEEVLEYLVS
ncbi:putative tail spike protein [Escherichia phage ECBP5]|uniref:Putative tail spike protein n=1 Tax=Escherichia phage ECBP5 TaxID=1498172 RepID=A0A0F6N6E9_9CAUD|nr:putative tail spike protein [Escherichia phage ECBP5]AID17712.1 putative tail spike protein [Escherichia phage ECBP5]